MGSLAVRLQLILFYQYARYPPGIVWALGVN
jgi:hypothetical protein